MSKPEDLRCRRCHKKLGELSVRKYLERFGVLRIQCPHCSKGGDSCITEWSHDPAFYIEKKRPLDDELEAVPA